MEEYRRQIIEAVEKIESIWLLEQILKAIKCVTKGLINPLFLLAAFQLLNLKLPSLFRLVLPTLL